MDASKGREHDWERFFAAQHRYARKFLPGFVGFIETLHAVERTETRNFVTLFLAMQEQ